MSNRVLKRSLIACLGLLLIASNRGRCESYFAPGPYGVGFQQYDAARAGSPQLLTSVWYPTHADADGNRDIYRLGEWNYESPFVGVTDSLQTPDQQFPLLVMSPGFGGNGFQFAPLGEALASHGYIVASPRHTTKDRAPRGLEQLDVLESLLARSQSSGDLLHGRVDPDALALGGFSWGAPTTQTALAATDREIDALLIFDGTGVVVHDVPLLHVGGGAYSLANMPQGDHRSDFFSLDVAKGTSSQRASHGSFILNRCQLRDAVLAAGRAAGAEPEQLPSIETCSSSVLSPDVVQDRVNRHAIEFLDGVFRHEPSNTSFLTPALGTTEGDLWIKVRVDSPASLWGATVMLTDPEGKSVGIDASTNELRNDFGSYVLGDPNDTSHAVQIGIQREALIAGDYTINVLASGIVRPQEYTINVGTAFDRGADIVYSQRVLSTGEFSPGESIDPVSFRLRDAYAAPLVSEPEKIDLLLSAIQSAEYDEAYDLNFDGRVDQLDISFWAEQMTQTWIGDSNLDGVFNSSDFVTLFNRNVYEDTIPMNATWRDGDWNGDGDFSTHDLVFAMTEGGYELGPRSAATPHAVPETTADPSLLLLLIAATFRRLTRSHDGS